MDFLDSDAPVDLQNWIGMINAQGPVIMFASSDQTKGLGKGQLHAHFKRKKLCRS